MEAQTQTEISTSAQSQQPGLWIEKWAMHIYYMHQNLLMMNCWADRLGQVMLLNY